MITGYVYFVTILTVNLLSVLAICLFSKYKGGLMTNMMMAMALSMVFGLAVGFFVGIAFHENLLYSTLISMSAAGVIGFIVGLQFHALAGIEGGFSGLMAGMMGSMVVEMLTVSDRAFLLLISLFLLIGTTMFCIRYMLQQTFQAFVQKYDYVLLIGTCLLILITFWAFPFTEIQDQESQYEEHHQQ